MISACWIILMLFGSKVAVAGKRFISSHSCSDTSKVCVSGGGTRKIDSFDVYKDCWEWSYTKTCNYPTKNNCNEFAGC